MTFIICQPLDHRQQEQKGPSDDDDDGKGSVLAGIVDTPDRMIGDINLFLSPYDNDDQGEEEEEHYGDDNTASPHAYYVGEVDIMIANAKDQGKGTGKAAVLAFLGYLSHHVGEILGEYTSSISESASSGPSHNDNNSTINGDGATPRHSRDQKAKEEVLTPKPLPIPKLHSLMAKINQNNERSIALFKSLGFKQDGQVNFFGEVKLVLSEAEFTRKFHASTTTTTPDSDSSIGNGNGLSGYKEMVYVRTEE